MTAVISAVVFIVIGLAVGFGGWFTLADPDRAVATLRNSATKDAKPETFRRRAKVLGWSAVIAGILIFLLGALALVGTLITGRF